MQFKLSGSKWTWWGIGIDTHTHTYFDTYYIHITQSQLHTHVSSEQLLATKKTDINRPYAFSLYFHWMNISRAIDSCKTCGHWQLWLRISMSLWCKIIKFVLKKSVCLKKSIRYKVCISIKMYQQNEPIQDEEKVNCIKKFFRSYVGMFVYMCAHMTKRRTHAERTIAENEINPC